MLKLLLVSNNDESLSELISVLKENDDIEVLHAGSGNMALEMVKTNTIDLVVADEEVGDMSGLAFSKKLITSNPMINCVAVSSLPEKDFHEASEGLGLMTNLPVRPGREETEKLLKNLRIIKGLESGH
ncbi:response regulator [Thermodesulfobacteriota bacterium]